MIDVCSGRAFVFPTACALIVVDRLQALNLLDKIRPFVDDAYDDYMKEKEMEDINYFVAE